MMATATSAHSSLHISRDSYSSPQDTLYFHMESAQHRVKKQRNSPPRSPPPAPPAVGPSDKDELGALKQLMVSPHKVQPVMPQEQHSYALHQLDTSPSSSPLPHPLLDTSPSPSPLPLPCPLSDEEHDQSPSQLYSNKHFFPSQSNGQDALSDADSQEVSPTPPLTRHAPQDDLSGLRRTSSATMSARITGGGLSRGGLYGALEGTMNTATMGSHRQITRQNPSLSTIGTQVVSTSLPLNEERRDLLLCDEGPQPLGATRPVPPPRHPTTPPPLSRYTMKLKSTASSPALLTSDTMSVTPRSRSVSFLQCDAGSDMGSFPADYLGSKEIDSYTNTVNTVAKQLVNSKAVEVIAYVSSEKLRLAPPRNQALLFKSFAVRDILGVEICSKNKRIVGVLVWKKGLPVCHILRCASSLMSAGLHESLLYQTQQVDDVANGAQDLSPETPPPSSSNPGETEDDILSPTDLLHKLPAVYIGCAGAGKLHSVSDVIDKVLCERQPSQSRAVGVWLSLSQVRLVATSDGQECAAHETSRIRAIGVCTRDKRYMGYIIKEEGKPLTGHVLHCTSAGLMVSLVSFLRQSCQLMVFQRGGSFYDELSADEDYEKSLEGYSCSQENKFVKHIRSLTLSFSNRTSVAPPTPTRPSFQSHTYLRKQLSPLSNDLPQKKRDAIQNPLLVSPLKYTQEDYARYSVTYVGSAALYLPFCRESVLDALEAFAEGGVASGKAAVTKNNIDMQVSALSVSLADKSHKLFVTRNYGRKQIQGFCVHPTDSKYFAFGSLRPGFPNNMKVHVFVHGEEPSSQIIASLQYWLELAPSL